MRVGDASDQSRLPDFVAGPEALSANDMDANKRRDSLVSLLKFLFLGHTGLIIRQPVSFDSSLVVLGSVRLFPTAMASAVAGRHVEEKRAIN